MNRPAHTFRLVLLAAVLLAAGRAPAFESVDALIGFLETNGVSCDRTNALRAALAAVLQTVDPEARLMSAAEAEALRQAGGPVFGSCGASSALSQAAPVESVELWPEGLAYLKVRALTPGCGQQVLGQLRTLDDLAGVVLDLRGADGTDLASVVDLASPFRRAGEALFAVEDLRGRQSETFAATSSPPFRVPLMVLADRDTCGAAEALAACLRHAAGVMLIGARTRGEAHLRELLPAPEGRFVWLATRRFVPAGRPSFETCGVEPDLLVTDLDPGTAVAARPPPHGRTPSAKTVRDRELMLRVNHDAVLRRTVDILLGLKALDHAGS